MKQAVLLYGSKTWVLLTTTLASLKGFHIRAAYQMAVRHKRRRGPGHSWIYPKSKDVLEECGMSTLVEYNTVCWQTIAVYLATRPVLTKCRQGKQKRGGSTTPLEVEATDGLGRQQCNWIRPMMVQCKSHSAVWQRGKKQKNNWAFCKGAAVPPPCGGFAATLLFCYSFSMWRVPLLGT